MRNKAKDGLRRVEQALAELGKEHTPSVNWQERIMAALSEKRNNR